MWTKSNRKKTQAFTKCFPCGRPCSKCFPVTLWGTYNYLHFTWGHGTQVKWLAQGHKTGDQWSQHQTQPIWHQSLFSQPPHCPGVWILQNAKEEWSLRNTVFHTSWSCFSQTRCLRMSRVVPPLCLHSCTPPQLGCPLPLLWKSKLFQFIKTLLKI